MNRWTFWIPIEGVGESPTEAWIEALEKLIGAIGTAEYEVPPEDLFTGDDPVPAAEILGGSLSAGFGIDHGPEDLSETSNEADEE